MNRPLRLIAGAVVTAATAGMLWLTPMIMAGITFNALD
jgi:hypothetical protein